MRVAVIASLIMVSGVAPTSATVLLAGSSGAPTQPFAVISATQGTMLASTTISGQALTFAATVRSAVYRNSFGTLDFYYQVARTGIGSKATNNNNAIMSITASDFTIWSVDAYASDPDPDGAGFFTAINNPGAPTTTFGRSFDGSVLDASFGSNVLSGLQVSATYIFRTNATRYETGTFGVINGSALQGLAFQPGAVPEPRTWVLFLAGFSLAGIAARRRVQASQPDPVMTVM